MSDATASQQYKMNLPGDLKARLQDRARASKRSLSAEVIATLEAALDRPEESAPLGTASSPARSNEASFARMLKELDSNITNSFQLFLEVRDEARRVSGGLSLAESFRLEPALRKAMSDLKADRAAAIQLILGEWLVAKGYLDKEVHGS